MPPKKKNGYKMPAHLPAGEVLRDMLKKQWILGPSVGKGGFGEIYSAKPMDNTSKEYNYVVKIEPHENGPLFVEMHFYTRCAREKDVMAFIQKKKLKHLGMPLYVASGSHNHNDEKYRFVVMEKYAPKDIWKLFAENNRRLPAVTVYRLALQMVDVLEYIHSMGYIHGDIKGANILLHTKDSNKAFLVDFGLASKFVTDVEFIPNPKKMHNGTIEYLSRDAHQGVCSRRGDIEILAFNMIHWLTGTLPWEGKSKPEIVQTEKEQYMKNVKLFDDCFNDALPKAIEELLIYIKKVSHNEGPDYDKIRKFLLKGLIAAGGTESSPLTFTSAQKRKSGGLDINGESKKRVKSTTKVNKASTKPATRKKTLQADSSDEAMDENDAPTESAMNAEELRILTLKESRSKATIKRRARKKIDSVSVNGDENDTPTPSAVNKKKTTGRSKTNNIVESPSRLDNVRLRDGTLDDVRRSPRTRKPVNYSDD